MKERNNCLDKIKVIMKGKLKDERINNRERYLGTLKKLILQAMIKLIEPSLIICCREDDKDDVEGMMEECETEYHEFMEEKTKRDEYNCTLSVM
jgi:V-type H+-transporting ATPase subunit E